MIRDTIDRFRYRFELWCRERREYSFWRGPWPELSRESRQPAIWEDPKYQILWTESTARFIVREVSLYVGIVLLLSDIAFVIDKHFRFARNAVGIIFLWLVGIWTLLAVLMVIDMIKKRKAYRLKNPKSSNQPLQLTADRHDDRVTLHEPPFNPNFPRFRQR